MVFANIWKEQQLVLIVVEAHYVLMVFCELVVNIVEKTISIEFASMERKNPNVFNVEMARKFAYIYTEKVFAKNVMEVKYVSIRNK